LVDTCGVPLARRDRKFGGVVPTWFSAKIPQPEVRGYATFIGSSLTVCMLSACVGSSGATETVTDVHGTVLVGLDVSDFGGSATTAFRMLGDPQRSNDYYAEVIGEECDPPGAGAEVVLADAAGKKLGFTRTSSTGVVVVSTQWEGNVTSVACEVDFTLSDVIIVGKVFELSLGGSDPMNLTAEDLAGDLTLTYG
jgi:hypothetical protein